MLVNCEVVIHIELHHRDNAAKIWNKAPKNTGFIHAPKHSRRVLFTGKKLQKNTVSLWIVAQVVINQMKRSTQNPNGVRVQESVRCLCVPEKPD